MFCPLEEITGYLTGDGHLDIRGTTLAACVASKDADYWRELNAHLSLGWTAVEMNGEVTQHRAYSKALHKRIMAWGGGRTSKEKRIPSPIWKSRREGRWAYVRGYFVADGTIGWPQGKYPFVAFDSASKGLLEDVGILLAGLEIGTTNISGGKRRDRKGNMFRCYVASNFLISFGEALNNAGNATHPKLKELANVVQAREQRGGSGRRTSQEVLDRLFRLRHRSDELEHEASKAGRVLDLSW